MGMEDRRLITSPAGETIEVVSDDDWAKLNGWPTHAPLNNPQRGRDAVIKALWEHGAYEDASGLAGSLLYADATARGYSGSQMAMSGVFRGSLAAGTDREIRGKRQYRIALTALPESWAEPLLSANGDRPEVFADDETNATEQNAEDLEPREPLHLVDTPADDEPEYLRQWKAATDLDVAQAVATALLTQVIDIVSTGRPDQARLDTLEAEADQRERDLLDAGRRLGDQLAETDRLRRQLRQVGDDLAAVKAERDGLRQRLRMAEANLSAAMRNERGDVIRDAVNDELAKIMRTAPVHRSADDVGTFHVRQDVIRDAVNERATDTDTP